MIYRELGKTGIRVGVVGLGSEHVDTKPREVVCEVIDAALERGINIMDMFMPGEEVRTNIGHALSGRRDKMLIQGAIGSVDLNQQYDISRDLAVCKRYFENMLRCLKTDYIDFGMLFFLDTHEDIDAMLNNGVVDYARRLKEAGKVRHIGATVHNPDTARRLVEEGLVEMLMFSINPAFDMMPEAGDVIDHLINSPSLPVTRIDPNRAELYRLCESRGVGLTVMKSLCAGKLLSTEHSPFAVAMTPSQCIHYALDRPAVASVLVGCQSRAEVESAVAYVDASESERDYTSAVGALKSGATGGFKGSCVYCNHCLPCPSGIDIGTVNKYLDIARLNEKSVSPGIAQHYRSLKSHGSDCIECGSCEERCPFSVPVMANMRAAKELFGE